MTTHEAKTQLSRLLAEVEAGEEVVICRGATPVARLTAVERATLPARPQVGTVTSGPISYAPDTFAPLSDRDLEDWGL